MSSQTVDSKRLNGDRFKKAYDKQQLQNQFAELARNDGVCSALKENSGFGWNDELKIQTAPFPVWDDYTAAHPLAKGYRYTTLIN